MPVGPPGRGSAKVSHSVFRAFRTNMTSFRGAQQQKAKMKKSQPKTEAATVEQLAEMLGASVLFVKVAGAIGCRGLDGFAPMAKNPAELARFLGVSRSTVSDWVRGGVPREPDGGFSIPKVVAWRNRRQAKPTNPRDDILRGFCRVLRVEAYHATLAAAAELAKASTPATDEDLRQLQVEIAMILGKHFGPLCPSESEVEQLLVGPKV